LPMNLIDSQVSRGRGGGDRITQPDDTQHPATAAYNLTGLGRGAR
jgi:hypothetical protein